MDITTLAAKAAQIGLPAVRAALLGPIGNAALVAVASKLGVPATPAALGAAMDDPETRLALARIDAEMQAESNRHDEAVMSDVQNARAMMHDHWLPPWLTIGLVMIVALFIAALMFHEAPEGNQRLLDTAFGAMLGAFTTAIAYWLGSSRGSAVRAKELEARR